MKTILTWHKPENKLPENNSIIIIKEKYQDVYSEMYCNSNGGLTCASGYHYTFKDDVAEWTYIKGEEYNENKMKVAYLGLLFGWIFLGLLFFNITTSKPETKNTNSTTVDTVYIIDTIIQNVAPGKLQYKTWTINSKDRKDWTELDIMAKMLSSETTDSTNLYKLFFAGSTAMNNLKYRNAKKKYGVETLLDIIIRKRYSGVYKENYWGWTKEPSETHKQIAWYLYHYGPLDIHKNAFVFNNPALSSSAANTWFDGLAKKGCRIKQIKETNYYRHPDNWQLSNKYLEI